LLVILKAIIILGECCKKESKIIKSIVEEAVNSADPIKLGITLHAYADTFSHQGFSGIVSKVNDVEGVRENKACNLQIITV